VVWRREKKSELIANRIQIIDPSSVPSSKFNIIFMLGLRSFWRNFMNIIPNILIGARALEEARRVEEERGEI
jgi:hypothetical protein